jgi:hypothetical protein
VWLHANCSRCIGLGPSTDLASPKHESAPFVISLPQIHRSFDYAVACAPTALRMTLLRGVAIFESQSKTGDEMDGMLTMQQAS